MAGHVLEGLAKYNRRTAALSASDTFRQFGQLHLRSFGLYQGIGFSRLPRQALFCVPHCA
jgi:hypothetical protein